MTCHHSPVRPNGLTGFFRFIGDGGKFARAENEFSPSPIRRGLSFGRIFRAVLSSCRDRSELANAIAEASTSGGSVYSDRFGLVGWSRCRWGRAITAAVGFVASMSRYALTLLADAFEYISPAAARYSGVSLYAARVALRSSPCFDNAARRASTLSTRL